MGEGTRWHFCTGHSTSVHTHERGQQHDAKGDPLGTRMREPCGPHGAQKPTLSPWSLRGPSANLDGFRWPWTPPILSGQLLTGRRQRMWTFVLSLEPRQQPGHALSVPCVASCGPGPSECGQRATCPLMGPLGIPGAPRKPLAPLSTPLRCCVSTANLEMVAVCVPSLWEPLGASLALLIYLEALFPGDKGHKVRVINFFGCRCCGPGDGTPALL